MDHEPVKPSLSETAISALQRGNKIEAIKLVREERGLGLKEAKDEVEDEENSTKSLGLWAIRFLLLVSCHSLSSFGLRFSFGIDSLFRPMR